MRQHRDLLAFPLEPADANGANGANVRTSCARSATERFQLSIKPFAAPLDRASSPQAPGSQVASCHIYRKLMAGN